MFKHKYRKLLSTSKYPTARGYFFIYPISSTSVACSSPAYVVLIVLSLAIIRHTRLWRVTSSHSYEYWFCWLSCRTVCLFLISPASPSATERGRRLINIIPTVRDRSETSTSQRLGKCCLFKMCVKKRRYQHRYFIFIVSLRTWSDFYHK